jgi:hypothetical protein
VTDACYRIGSAEVVEGQQAVSTAAASGRQIRWVAKNVIFFVYVDPAEIKL